MDGMAVCQILLLYIQPNYSYPAEAGFCYTIQNANVTINVQPEILMEGVGCRDINVNVDNTENHVCQSKNFFWMTDHDAVIHLLSDVIFWF